MPRRDFEITGTRMSWRRRLVIALILGMVATVVWRFSAVMIRRATVKALEDSGWTIVYDDAAQPAVPAFLDKIATQLGSAGQFLTGMLGREPEIVEVRIADMEAPAAREAKLSMLERLPSLQRLYVQREALTPADVASIGSVDSLTGLTLASDALTDESLSQLAGLSHLKRLTIVSQRVTDEGLAHFVGNSSLQSLDLQSTRAGGSGIEAFPRLESLALGPFTDNGDLESVSRLPHLKELILTDSRISDDGFRHLGSLQSLEVLYLSGPHAVTDEGLEVLGDFDRLVQLTLHGQHFTFAGLRSVADSTSLVELELRGGGLDDAGLDAFVPPPSLKVLRLDYTSISDEGFDRFERRCPEVELWR
jgi:Leucine Rich repeat